MSKVQDDDKTATTTLPPPALSLSPSYYQNNGNIWKHSNFPNMVSRWPHANFTNADCSSLFTRHFRRAFEGARSRSLVTHPIFTTVMYVYGPRNTQYLLLHRKCTGINLWSEVPVESTTFTRMHKQWKPGPFSSLALCWA